MGEVRPTPEVFLSRLRREDRKGRGQLKVFFGMSAGVGKTYAMLETAQALRMAGKDILVGVVETHGRAETEALLEGLPVLPRRESEYRGMRVREFDLDAALERRPAAVVVDELAHTNGPGSRHAKRYRDVEELLAAGIDVLTAINVQHVESLNDAVAQITGIRVRETVPDAILEGADEVVLMDLPPEDLLLRLREGKVYLGEQAEHAAEMFLKPSNLAALRELALRFVAERVGARVEGERHDSGSSAIWPTRERLLVGVGPAPSSARLIRSTKRLAGLLQAPWIAVSVETPATARLPAAARERISEHLRMAERLGAEVATVSGASVADALLALARERNVTKLVVGKPVLPRWREFLRPSPVDDLIRRSGDIDVYVIRGEGDAPKSGPPPSAAAPGRLPPYRFAVLSVIAASAVAWAMYGHFVLADLIMVYLVGIAATATRGSRGATLVASLLSVLAFNILFVPPRFSLSVASTSYLATFGVMFLVSLAISSLSIRLREQRDLARLGEERSTALFRLTQRLAGARGLEALGRVVVEEASRTLGGEARLYLRDTVGTLTCVRSGGGSGSDDEKEMSVAQWVLENGHPAGRGTETLAAATLLHIPLIGGNQRVGVLSVGLPEGQRLLFPEQRLMVDALARQAALALDVERLEQQHRAAQLEAENERLRGAILSAVSHDLRTPLASIIGSASGLVDSPESYPEATRRDLLRTILEEAERLNRLIANLLEMTRLEGGGLQVRREAVGLEDLLSGAIEVFRRHLAHHPIEVSIPPDLPFVLADEILLHHVFMNLLENAVKLSPEGSPVTVAARREGSRVSVEIADRGPGIPPGEEERIFEKFHRGAGGARRQGVGLGLAICKGLVEAHGGTIRASNRDGGGACFRFDLPVADVQPPPDEEPISDSGGAAP